MHGMHRHRCGHLVRWMLRVVVLGVFVQWFFVFRLLVQRFIVQRRLEARWHVRWTHAIPWLE